MVPKVLPVVELPRLERAINNARWVGAVVVVAIGPFFQSVGTGYLVALVLGLVGGAIVIPRLRHSYVAQIVDTGIVILAMLIFAPDPDWPTAIIGIFLIMGGAFRFGRIGTLVAAVVATLAYLGVSVYREVAFGYPLVLHRLATEPAIYFITALFMAGIIWQIEALRRRTDEETGRYQALLRAQSDLGQLVLLTESGRAVYMNEAFANLVGRPLSAFDDVGSLYDLVALDERAAFQAKVETHVRTEQSLTIEIPIVRPDGERRFLEVALKPFGTASRARLVLIARDITDRRHAEDALAHQALHDILTGLPNRTLLHDRLDQAIHEARRRTETLALLVIDLDEFKAVNDSFGHHVGDALLTQVGPRFQSSLREVDTVARLGGDEFAVVLPGADASSAGRVAAALLKSLERPFGVQAEELVVGASIGVAVYPSHGDSAQILLQHADIAMYAAKAELGNGYSVYTPEQDRHGADRLGQLADLRRAIEGDELILEYQPLISLRTGRVTSVEALVRWNHPTRGLIQPNAFIPFAEQTGLIKPLTERVMDQALHDVGLWRARHHDCPVAVNLSTRNLLDPLLPDLVRELLFKHDVPPAALRFEITESVLLGEPERAMETLNQLRAIGVRFALDDFGSGYSSLSYLHRLPLEEVKIDQSFIRELSSADASGSTIVGATVDLGHRLGFAVVAEGVESREEWDRLISLGCDIVQGFHIARPMPVEEVLRWLDVLRATPRALAS
jgi:diguanylate cyclase (GGDEF)-like protein/PAS domain S-box-containing protein